MKHMLSKVSFIIKKSTDYSNTGTLTQICLKSVGKKISTKAAFTVGTPDTAPTPSADQADLISQILLKGSKPINENSNTAETAYMLVVPKKYDNHDFVLTMTIDGKEMTVNSLPTTIDWSLSLNYQYTVTVSSTGLTVSSVIIKDWTPDTSTPGMNAN